MKHEKIPMNCFEIINKILDTINLTGKKIILNQNKCTQFFSKKHFVIKTELLSIENSVISESSNEIVIKMFNNKIFNYLDRWNNEINQYLKLSSLFGNNFLPNLIFSCPGIAIYEFIQGESYFDLLMTHKLTNDSLTLLAECFFKINEQGLVFGDARLRNFIFSKSKNLFLVDYEEIHEGNIIRDISNFIISFIDNNPGIFEGSDIGYNLNCMIYFLDSYQLLKSGSKSQIIPNHENIEDLIDFWIKQIEISLKIVIERRSLKIRSAKMEKMKKEIKNAFFQYYSSQKY
jgi:thiamine kinase-like enzyme